ncbi:MAG: TonB family protein [Halobacteriovoraceae bacterium]|nr:TonB family protein [Halobacteriovoraceae bacterium]
MNSIPQEDKKEKKRSGNVLYFTLITSFLLHILILPIHLKLSQSSQKKKKEANRIKLVLQTKDSKKKQIVTTESKKQKDPPLNTRFLSKNNNKVDRQTKSSTTAPFKAAALGVKHGSKNPSNASREHQTIKRPSLIPKKKISLQDLSFEKTRNYQKMTQKTPPKGLKNGQRKRNPGLAQNNDYLQDIPLGDMTALNSKQFKFYGFYFRIKQKIEQFWGNSLREKATALYRSGRRLASNNTRITSLRITLDKKGNIVDISIKTTSGIQELDDAAIESFNQAGPFPNPPREMIKDGVATIEWGFVVKS